MKIVLLGPPGAGKGTQATKIVEGFGLCHISTGDIFRKNLREETPLGIEAKGYMDKGLLVPDDVTVKMVESRLQEDDIKKGYMLDGFPRTIMQAEALDEILAKNNEKLDCALLIEVDYSVLTDRITGRRMCKDCGSAFHVTFNPPKEEGVCDNCGGSLYQRDDDKEETVVKRLAEYDAKTQPLIKYYQDKNILKSVDGQTGIDNVYKDISKILEGFK